MHDDAHSSAARPSVWGSRAWIAVLVVAGVVEAVVALGMPLPELAVLVPDDSYFYLQVAWRFVDSGAFAFGPGPETYGFQPLWQLLVIGLAAVTPDRAALLYATLAACIVLRTLTGIALFALGRSLWGTAAGVFASAVWVFNPAVAVWSWGLKENTLYALFLVLAAHALVVLLRGGATRRRAALLGLWLGLCVFTRVNALLVAGVMLAVALVAPGGERRGQRFPRVVLAGAVALVVAAPWYLFAWQRFGTLMPTSGTWKLEIGRLHVESALQVGWWSLDHVAHGLRATAGYLAATLAHGFGPIEFLLAGAAAAAVLGLPIVSLRRGRGAAGGAAAWWVTGALVLGAAVGAWLTAMTLEPYLAYAKWYTVPEYVAIAVVAGAVLGQAFALRRHVAGRVLVAAALVAALLVWPGERWRARGPWLGHTLPRHLLATAPSATQTLELGLWAARHVPEGLTLGMFDPGAITYFSGRDVISLDPLMNSLEYQHEGRRDHANHYLRFCIGHGISHVVGSGFVLDGKWMFRGLPPETYDVLWVPFPDHPLPWGGYPVHLMVVRLRGVEAPEFIVPGALPHGIHLPNESGEARVMEASSPARFSGDALRLRVRAGTGGSWSLHTEAGPVAAASVDGNGWAFLDLRPLRGRRASLRFDGGETMPALLEAYEVDYGFPVRP